jgi:hypothetical protein
MKNAGLVLDEKNDLHPPVEQELWMQRRLIMFVNQHKVLKV